MCPNLAKKDFNVQRAEEPGPKHHVTMPKLSTLTSQQRRINWRNIPQVQSLGLANNLSKKQLLLQEIKFELIITQDSYFHKIHRLYHHVKVIKASLVPTVLEKQEYEIIFRDIPKIRKVVKDLHHDFGEMWRKSPMMDNIVEVIGKHANKIYNAYTSYCKNTYKSREYLERLRKENRVFREKISQLESALGFNLESDLTAPVQRIALTNLLLGRMLENLPEDSEEYQNCSNARKIILNTLSRGNELANRFSSECDKYSAIMMTAVPDTTVEMRLATKKTIKERLSVPHVLPSFTNQENQAKRRRLLSEGGKYDSIPEVPSMDDTSLNNIPKKKTHRRRIEDKWHLESRNTTRNSLPAHPDQILLDKFIRLLSKDDDPTIEDLYGQTSLYSDYRKFGLDTERFSITTVDTENFVSNSGIVAVSPKKFCTNFLRVFVCL